MSEWSSLAVGIVCLAAAFLQWATANHAQVRTRTLVRAGKRVMAGGFLLAALRFFYIGFGGTWVGPTFQAGELSLLILALGSIFSNFERVFEDNFTARVRKGVAAERRDRERRNGTGQIS